MDPIRRAGAAPARTSVGPASPGPAALLLVGTPPEVLARIVPEDPLGLRPRLVAHTTARALLVDTERLLLRAQALCALHSFHWRGEPELERWLDQRAEEALTLFLAEEQSALEGGALEPLEPFARPLALDPFALADACARFNRLALEQRRAFVALVLEAAEPDRLARGARVSLSELFRRARAGLELFRGAFHPAWTRPARNPRSPRT